MTPTMSSPTSLKMIWNGIATSRTLKTRRRSQSQLQHPRQHQGRKPPREQLGMDHSEWPIRPKNQMSKKCGER